MEEEFSGGQGMEYGIGSVFTSERLCWRDEGKAHQGMKLYMQWN